MVNGSPIAVFNHVKFGDIRIVDNDGEQWFVAKDIAAALGYSKTRNAVAAHCKGGEFTPLSTSGGEQSLRVIPESDVYRLVMRSRLPDAEAFQDWVCGEVLPAIRKTGSYKAEESYEETVSRALRLTAERIEVLEAKAKVDAPKVEFFDRVTGSETNCQLGVACQVASLSMGRNTLFKTLREQGVLISSGERKNHPRQEFVDRGYFTVVGNDYTDPDTEKTYVTYVTHCTQRGIDWLIKRFGPETEATQ